MKIFTDATKAEQDDTCRIPMTAEERKICEDTGVAPRMSDITWRIFRIMAEFVEGFQFLSTLSKEVTVFGSARLPATNKWYQEAVVLGRLLGEAGFTVVTGGGPGIMEAANKGAHEAGGRSVGLNIQLPNEQRVNDYVTSSRAFHYFFTRKVILAASAQAYVYFPGGFGTQDELFEILTLLQTGKSDHVPVVLVGVEYWSGLVDWIKGTMLDTFDTISAEDLDLFHLVDSGAEAFDLVKDSTERTFF
jgi:uncharacterized protein (TIGR00730 family)